MSIRYYELSFLGHHVCPEDISPLPSPVDPKSKEAKLTPLNTLLTEDNTGHRPTRLSPKSNFDLNWNESADLAFIVSKQILANATLLVHPDLSAQLNITCDPSGDFVVVGVLQ